MTLREAASFAGVIVMAILFPPNGSSADGPRYARLTNVASAVANAGNKDAKIPDDKLAIFYNILFDPTAYEREIERGVLDRALTLRARNIICHMIVGMPRNALFDITDRVVEAARLGQLGYGGENSESPGLPSILACALAPLSMEPIPLSFRDDRRWSALLERALTTPNLESPLRAQIMAALKPVKPGDRFEHVMRAIAADATRNGDRRYSFFKTRAFREIYLTPAAYREDAERLIVDETESALARTAAALSMQALPTEQLGILLAKIVETARDRRLDTDVLLAAVKPPSAYANGRQFLYADTPTSRDLLDALTRVQNVAPELNDFIATARDSQTRLAKGMTYEIFLGTLEPLAGQRGDALLLSNPFDEIYQNPLPYVALAKRAIMDRTVGVETKVIACQAMQRLSQDDLLDLLNTIVDAAARGTLDRQADQMLRILDAALRPPSAFNAFLPLFYDNAKANALLAKAVRIRQLDTGLREAIEKDRSGVGRAQTMESIEFEVPVRTDYLLGEYKVFVPL